MYSNMSKNIIWDSFIYKWNKNLSKITLLVLNQKQRNEKKKYETWAAKVIC